MVDTVRSLAELQAILADNTSGQISPQDMRDVLVSLAASSGWANYLDTQYSDVSPFNIVAGPRVQLPNNAGSTIETHLPFGVTSFYDGSKILGLNGDGMAISFGLTAVPTAPAATYLQIQIDIGGAIGVVFDETITFPKGSGTARPVFRSYVGYNLDTWEANDATVYVQSDGPVSLYGMRYIITRTHRNLL